MKRLILSRRLTQALLFLVTGQWLLLGFLRCPFGVPFVCCGSCPLSDCSGTVLQRPILAVIVVTGFLCGRVFCGWVCPLGYLNDAFGRFPKPELDRQRWFLAVEPWLRNVKFLVLALCIWFLYRYNFPSERAHPYVVRSPSLFNLDSYRVAVALGAKRYPIRALVLAGALLSGLVIPRFWCRYLCPVGAMLVPFSKLSAKRLSRTTACTNCGKYPRECPQNTTPGTTDCIICGDCVEDCPQSAVAFGKTHHRETAAR